MAAEHFLRHELPRMGFPIEGIQIDGGSEFKAKFERACQALGIALYVLPPRSPRLNGKVERAHRTHQEEFYDLVEVPDDLVLHNTLLREHEAVYNGLRPHQALAYVTSLRMSSPRAARPITNEGGKCLASTEAVHRVDRIGCLP